MAQQNVHNTHAQNSNWNPKLAIATKNLLKGELKIKNLSNMN